MAAVTSRTSTSLTSARLLRSVHLQHLCSALASCCALLFSVQSIVIVGQGLLRLHTLNLRACRRVGNKGVGHFVAAYAAPEP